MGSKSYWLLLGHDNFREPEHCFLSAVFCLFKKKLLLIIYFPLRQGEVYRAEISYNLHVIVCGGLPFMAALESGF